MERSLTPVEIGVSRPDKKVYLWFWSLSVHEAGSGEVFSLPVVHISDKGHTEFARHCRRSARAKAKQALRNGHEPAPKYPVETEYYD